MSRPIVLFDGVCKFCDASVNFIIDRDPGGRIRFAPLQSEPGRAILRRLGLSTEAMTSLVLVEGRRHFTRSTAALRIARLLSWPWPLAALLLGVPDVMRDPLYDLVARNRYRWFGTLDSCRVPTPEVRSRFLADGEA